MTVHVSITLEDAVKAKLDEIAELYGADPAALAAQAVERMVEDEAAFNAAMDEAEADVREGRVFSNEEVFRHIDSIIAKYE